MDGRDWKALPEDRETSRGQPGGWVGVGRPTRMNGRDCEALPEGWEASRGPPGGLGGVCRPIRRVVRSWEWSGGCEGLEGPPGGPEGIGRLSGRARRGREALPEGQEQSGGFPVSQKGLGGTGGVPRPFQKVVRGWEDLS